MSFRFLRDVNVDGMICPAGVVLPLDAIPQGSHESLRRNGWVEVVDDATPDEESDEQPAPRKRGKK